MNLIDVFLILVVLMTIWSGWRKGFILGSLELLMLIGSVLIAFWGYQYVANVFQRYAPGVGIWTLPISFLIVFFTARLLLGAIANSILVTLPYNAHNNVVNHLGGTIPGLIKGVIYATLIAALLLALPFFDALTLKTRESKFAGRMAEGVEWMDNKFSPVFDEAIKMTLNKLTVDPQSQETVDLPFKITDVKVREDLEAQMIDLVNEERAKHNLPPVKPDPEMAEVARKHSRDMFARGYFSHVNPDGEDPFDRMREEGVKFLNAGENLALAPTLSIAHRGLMNSPGHRANILQPNFGRLGIGILDGGMRGLMITQKFRN